MITAMRTAIIVIAKFNYYFTNRNDKITATVTTHFFSMSTLYTHIVFTRIPNFCRASMVLKFFYFEPNNILKLSLTIESKYVFEH